MTCFGLREFMRVFAGFDPKPWPTPADKVRMKMLYPRRTLKRRDEIKLKEAIILRLHTHNYSRVLPKERHRYKLKKVLIMYGGFVDEVWQ